MIRRVRVHLAEIRLWSISRRLFSPLHSPFMSTENGSWRGHPLDGRQTSSSETVILVPRRPWRPTRCDGPGPSTGALYRKMPPAPQGLSHDNPQRTVAARSAEACVIPANASTFCRSRLSDVQKTEHRDIYATSFPTMRPLVVVVVVVVVVVFSSSAVLGGEGSSGPEGGGSRASAPGRRHTTPADAVPRRRGTVPHHRTRIV